MSKQKSQTQTVYVASHNGKKVYHTNEDCQSALGCEQLKPVNKKRFPQLRECKRCAEGEAINHSENARSSRECPYCGETVYHLAKHLPGCSET